MSAGNGAAGRGLKELFEQQRRNLRVEELVQDIEERLRIAEPQDPSALFPTVPLHWAGLFGVSTSLLRGEPMRAEVFTLSGPLALFGKVVDRWGVKSSEACSLLGLEPTDLLRLYATLHGQAPLVGRDAADRLDAVAEVYRSVTNRFGRDPFAERVWLRAETTDLDGMSPIAMMTEKGMEGLLTVRDYLRWIDGR